MLQMLCDANFFRIFMATVFSDISVLAFLLLCVLTCLKCLVSLYVSMLRLSVADFFVACTANWFACAVFRGIYSV